jgi:transposase
MVRLGNTLVEWKEEVARMFRFTKSNGITEEFHNKMELISRRAMDLETLKTTDCA